MNNIDKSIRKIQQKYRLRRKIINNFNKELDILYNLIYSCTYRINESYNNNVFSQHKYNTNINKLEGIVNSYRELPKPLRLSDLVDIKISFIREKINSIKKNLCEICTDCGAMNINDILLIAIGKDLSYICNNKSSDYRNLLIFFNKMFIPTSYTM